jgi:hypothetical protein
VPVYNVALSLLRHTFPERPPFHVLTVSGVAPAEAAKVQALNWSL